MRNIFIIIALIGVISCSQLSRDLKGAAPTASALNVKKAIAVGKKIGAVVNVVKGVKKVVAGKIADHKKAVAVKKVGAVVAKVAKVVKAIAARKLAKKSGAATGAYSMAPKATKKAAAKKSAKKFLRQLSQY